MLRTLLSLSMLCFFLVAFRPEATDMPMKSKWVTLFNGKNLDGWKVKITGHPMGENFGNTFRVEQGILSIRYDQYKSFDNTFGALYCDKRFTNYRLKVEYRFVGETAQGAPVWGFRDSGIQYQGQGPAEVGLKQNFPVSLEFNLHGGNGRDDRPNGEICTIGTYIQFNGKRNESFCTPPATRRTFHGDVWVTAEIEVRDGKIAHFVNGEEVIRFENPKYDPAHEVGKTLIKKGDDAVRSGFISLQSNSHPIDFRKIEIMEY